ncbi:hypothetical protein T492DRAFT_1089987 [Pavlovales sp. CCMP2436]|nr:hypothetical protein T492DRAFT_1089987 [Pavlovales sp. CCMP2436]
MLKRSWSLAGWGDVEAWWRLRGGEVESGHGRWRCRSVHGWWRSGGDAETSWWRS